MGVVPPPCGTTPIASGLQSLVRRVTASASWPISCPNGPGIVNLAGIRVIVNRIDPPAGRLQVLAPKRALGMMVSLRWAQARLVGGRRPDAHGVWRYGVAGIGQLADGPGRRGRDDGRVEIRIVLDRAEPPVGRLRVVRAPGQAPGPRAGQEISFTGWLGLLRALYEVTAESGEGARPGP
jgi:hypothetical protein